MKYAALLVFAATIALLAMQANALVLSQHTTRVQCEDSGNFWCNYCSGKEGNNFGRDVCLTSSTECFYSCAKACGSQCTANNDCKTNLTDTSCYYSGTCSSCSCNYVAQECLRNGTVLNGVCHYGLRECSTSGCAIGKCELKSSQVCDPENGCVYVTGSSPRAEYYEDYKCVGESVYAKKVFYSCNETGCVYSKYDAFIQRCEDGCDDGKCRDAICNFNGIRVDCNTRDGFYDDRYCIENNVYRTYRDYFCGPNECVHVPYEIKQETCQICDSGKCAVPENINITDYTKITPPKNTTQLPFGVIYQTQNYVLHKGGRVYNGILFGKGDVVVDTEANRRGILFFNITKTNRLGTLSIITDGKTIFSGTPKAGSYRISFDGIGDKILFTTGSSGLWLLAPASYEIKYVTIYYE